MASTHIYSAYDDELKFLSRRISEMGGMAEQMVSDAVRALVNGDTRWPRRSSPTT
jgi:phosphate transport system protein